MTSAGHNSGRRRSRFGSALTLAASAGLGGQAARAAPTLATLTTFNGNGNGINPTVGYLSGDGRTLYGTTEGGGPGGGGTVFAVPTGGGAVTTLGTFNAGTSGSEPEPGLVVDRSGNLYGTTYTGGTGSDGTVFRVPAGGGVATPVAAFNGAGNGANPYAGLTADAAGNLYGTTQLGGANNQGTVFEVPAAGGGQVVTLATFDGAGNGAQPHAGLLAGAAGTLYGTTFQGGANGFGTVFAVPAGDGGQVVTLATFNGAGNGANPGGEGTLISDAAGNLYGTTRYGGADDVGTVFELPAGGGGQVVTLATFNGTGNGAQPSAGLVLDAAGDLYGTASAGGADSHGTVFEVVAGTGAVTTLATFNGTGNGADPDPGLIVDPAGDLFGTTRTGGATGDGTAFEVTGGGFVTSVPEPASSTVFVAAGVAVLSRRRRLSTARRS